MSLWFANYSSDVAFVSAVVLWLLSNSVLGVTLWLTLTITYKLAKVTSFSDKYYIRWLSSLNKDQSSSVLFINASDVQECCIPCDCAMVGQLSTCIYINDPITGSKKMFYLNL